MHFIKLVELVKLKSLREFKIVRVTWKFTNLFMEAGITMATRELDFEIRVNKTQILKKIKNLQSLKFNTVRGNQNGTNRYERW